MGEMTQERETARAMCILLCQALNATRSLDRRRVDEQMSFGEILMIVDPRELVLAMEASIEGVVDPAQLDMDMPMAEAAAQWVQQGLKPMPYPEIEGGFE